jgi:hypothetical protein
MNIMNEAMKDIPKLAEAYSKLSQLEYIEFAVLPRYLAVRLDKTKRAVLSEYGKNVDAIKHSQEEINAQSDRILDFYEATNT